ncbi:MAG: hypothetical protein JXX28_04870 [Deltaproteobacteria bacterium]|nr:hypothetical protein [Deltaproteobacteria bacterium]
MQELDQLIGVALAHQTERDWESAGRAWEAVAARGVHTGQLGVSLQAWDRAGETWRRADLLRPASRALHQALVLSGGAPALAAMPRIKLAATLGELGQYRAGCALCEEALQHPLTEDQRALALDTWLGARVNLGEKWGTEGALAELAALSPIAGAFRQVQRDHLDGALERALDALDALIDTLSQTAGMEAGVAGATGERGEVLLLLGDAVEAEEAFSYAAETLTALGRPSLTWRAEAGRARAQLATGARPLTTSLEEGLAYAQRRELPMLEADLLLVLAEVGGGTGGLERVIALCGESALRRGRAHLLLTQRGRPGHSAAALSGLSSSRTWYARAMLADGQLAAARAAMEEMGMRLDLARLPTG